MVAYHVSHFPMWHQRGGALLVMLVIWVIGITTVFVTSVNSQAILHKRKQLTALALARAKEALIGYAVSYADTHPLEPVPGYLPCPDVSGRNGEGSSSTCGKAGANSIGRLPWKTLDLPTLFDGQHDCLWYAVSGNYKNNPKYGGSMNWDTPAQLHVFDSHGNELQAGEVVAVVISPGLPLPGNSDRGGTGALPTCGGNYTASAYLDIDTIHAINHSDAAAGKFILPHEHRDARGNITLQTNDQFVFITRQDIWSAIEKRIAREAKLCLDDYAKEAGGKYPLAASVVLPALPALFGRLPPHPNRTVPTADDWHMIRRVTHLTDQLRTYKADRDLATVQTLALSVKEAAKIVERNYAGVNYGLEDAARRLQVAADTVTNWDTWPGLSAIDDVLNGIDNAAAIFSSHLPVDHDMPASWPASCTLFSSERWTNHWQTLIFYHLAEGFRPGSNPPHCDGRCLRIEGKETDPEVGGYHAVVIASGAMRTSRRNSSSVSDYLEADNLLPSLDVSNPYKTYRTTDSAYQTINDLVLCLDGGTHCK